jgi:hypothetical protein
MKRRNVKKKLSWAQLQGAKKLHALNTQDYPRTLILKDGTIIIIPIERLHS